MGLGISAYHVGGQLVTRQIFYIFMVCVDDFCQFTVVHHLLEHPHVHCGVKLVILGCVGTHNFGNGRAPGEMETITVKCIASLQKDNFCPYEEF